MPINPVLPAIALPPSEFSVTNASPRGNAQTSNPPVSENPAAFPSPSHQQGGAASRQQIPSAQALLLEKNAESLAKKDPDEFCRLFDADASKLPEKSRIKLAWLVLYESAGCLAKNIQKFKISDESTRIALAESVAGDESDELCAHIQNFEISDEKSKIKIAKDIAEKNSFPLAKHIHNFKISDESARIGLAQIVAEKEPFIFTKNIKNFDIDDESAKIALAHKIAEEDPSSLVQNIQNFAIADESARMGLAQTVAEKKPAMFIRNIQKFAISNESAKIELAQILAAKHPEVLANHIHNFKISDESARIGLAQNFAEKYPEVLVQNIQNFAIADESAKMELAQILVRKHLSTSLIKKDGFFEKLQISTQSVRCNLYASTYLGLLAKGDMRATDKAWINQFFPHDPEPMTLAQVAAQFGKRHSVITDLLEGAEQHAKPEIREILSTWTHLVSLRFAADQLPEAAWQELKAPLDAIQKWRAPAMRYVLTHLLAQQCLLPEAKDVNGFFAFCKQFTKPHTHLYSTLLFPLFQSAPDDPILKKLVRLLHQSDFKDAKRQKAMANALLALVQADGLSDGLKRSLLQAALPNGSDHEAVRSLADTAPAIECLVSLALPSTELGNAVLPRLKSIQNPGDFNEQMNEVFKDLFPDLSNAQNAAAQFRRYREHSRYPAGVLSYAAKIQSGLHGDEKASVMATISQFVNATVLSPHPEQAFKQLRYDPTKSLHLRLLANKAPDAFAQWQQPCIYKPSAAFLANTSDSTKQTNNLTDPANLFLLTPSSRQDAKQFSVVDTDAAEDLFLCSTEVAGSCQTIQEQAHLNKALMAYALDGKYRLLAIKSPDGRLMGRRLLRLLWNERRQQPVLHLEHFYHNPGIPEKYAQALVELALQKAKQMGCVLVSHDRTLQSGGFYLDRIRAYPTPWPFESVDGERPAVHTGREGYQLSGATVVASLH